MATIKDVAKLAGVSHGTVSNILNGVKGVSLDKVKKVEKAIKILGYQPDAAARSLKTNKTMNVGIVLPNITDSAFAQLFTNIERVLSERNYSTSLYITSEIAENEKRILTMAQRSKMDGIIIVTCQPDNVALFKQLMDSGIKMVFADREIDNKEYNFISFNNEKLVQNIMQDLIENNYKTIAIITGPSEYSSEKHCIKAYKNLLNQNGLPVNDKMIEITNYDKESAFKAAFRLFQLKEIPDVIVTTSTLLADGVLEALSLVETSLSKKPKVLSICDDSWTKNKYPDVIKIPKQYMHLGELAAETLLNNIDNPAFYDPVNILLDCSYESMDLNGKYNTGKVAQKSRKADILKVLLLESPASYATYSLLADFKRREGIEVRIDAIKYKELYETIKDESKFSNYDVFQIDVPWYTEFVETGMLADLSGYLENDKSVLDNEIPGIPEEYVKFGDKYFALPYMYCAQLLFYRKDLFENIKYNRMFYEEYKTELKPPRTWNEFNAVAKFFTKHYNPESETLYGTTLGGKFSSGAVNEFLPRLWAFGGECINADGEVVLNSKEAIKALNNYVESFRYASPTSADHWWEEQVEEFSDGKAAMMILYNAHVADITDRNKSKVVGNIAFDIIPGGTPVFGGWSLGINKNSSKIDKAFRFISWACGNELAIPNTILGGCPPCVNLYKTTEFLPMYPWLPKSLEVLNYHKKRFIPKTKNGTVISERSYEEILGGAVYKSITNQMLPEEAIKDASLKLKQLLEL